MIGSTPEMQQAGWRLAHFSFLSLKGADDVLYSCDMCIFFLFLSFVQT